MYLVQQQQSVQFLMDIVDEQPSISNADNDKDNRLNNNSVL